MTDAILRSRVLALERQLELVAQSPFWLDAMDLRIGEVADELRTELDATIGQHARRQKSELRAIAESLDGTGVPAEGDAQPTIADHWRQYLRVHDASEEIFSECLEFFGGLAIRKNGWDDQICQVADELIRTCARESTGDPWISCTVPAPHEALAKTLARMVRLRFPDWSVWTLPFTAHEYGHVALVEAPYLARFVAAEVRKAVEAALPGIVSTHASVLAREHGVDDVTGLREEIEPLAGAKLEECLHAPEPLDDVRSSNGAPPTVGGIPTEEATRLLALRLRETVRRERIRMHVLIADAFATYTMGPAYCCAALMLRFMPSRSDEAVFDTERAEVTLAMLRRMNKEGQADRYGKVLQELDERWDQAVLRARAPAKLDAPAVDAVKRLVDDAWRVFQVDLLPSALYPDGEQNEGWLAAEMLSVRWRNNLRARQALDTRALPLSKLRDAINAAWSCRLVSEVDDTQDIEAAAVLVCKAIIEQRDQRLTERSSQGAFR